MRDVTERKQAEDKLRESERHYRELAERNRLLVREVEHRVGNNLAALIALVSMMKGRVRDVELFAGAIESRLRGMAQIHRMLVEAGWSFVDLRKLISSLFESLRYLPQCAAQERIEGPEIIVSPRRRPH